MASLRGLFDKYFGASLWLGERHEPDPEAADEHFRTLLRRVMPVLGVLAIVANLVMWPTDQFFPDAMLREAFFGFRVVITACVLSLLAGLRLVPLVKRRPLLWSAAAYVVIIGYAGHVLGQSSTLDDDQVFWVLLALDYLVVAIPMRLRHRVLTHTLVRVAFTLPYLLAQRDVLSQQLFPQAVVVSAATVLLSVSLGALMSALMRRSFWQARALEEANAKSDRLLNAMLPEPIAARLKERPGTIADYVDDATVMFVDLVGFTTRCETLTAAEVVDLLNEVFSAFDALTSARDLEKIKTIGDAYMVVAGVAKPRTDHAAALADLALEIRQWAARRGGEHPIEVRIGLHVGAVVAGVIGSSRPSYDVWGDTVNTAARMESHGVAGEIQLTDALRRRLGDRYRFEERGELSVKGKGEMTTWLLRGRDAA